MTRTIASGAVVVLTSVPPEFIVGAASFESQPLAEGGDGMAISTEPSVRTFAVGLTCSRSGQRAGAGMGSTTPYPGSVDAPDLHAMTPMAAPMRAAFRSRVFFRASVIGIVLSASATAVSGRLGHRIDDAIAARDVRHA